ncbi:MAG TPA: choice-of-anchor D domain-containing protein [Myxococcales bacterium]|nr:choice-of-anchor D domain-containing protein [Myxococcales bacterium]
MARALWLLLGLAAGGCHCGPSQYVVQVCGLTVSPAFLDAGEVLVGTTATEDLAVANGGTGPLTLESATLAQDGGASFALPGFAPTTLNPGQPMLLHVTFTPPAAGAYDGTLTIQTDACQQAAPIELSGVGVAYGLAVSPATVAFDCVELGTTSAPQAVTVTNPEGTPETVTVGSFPAGSGFELEAPDGGAAVDGGWSIGLAPGGSFTLAVTYTAPDAGTAEAQAALSIEPCADCAASQVLFSAKPVQVTLSASPNDINFGAVPAAVAVTSTPIAVCVQENGCDLPVTLTAPPTMAVDAGFSATPVGAWPAVLVPDGGDAGSCASFEVSFQGPASGGSSVDDTALIGFSVSGVPQAPLQVPVAATPEEGPCSGLVLTPSAIAFGTVQAGQSVSGSVTISNGGLDGGADGGPACEITDVAVSNDALQDFRLAPNTPNTFTLSPGGSVTILGEFAPQTASAPLLRTGTLILDTDDPVEPQIDVPMTGTVEASVTGTCCDAQYYQSCNGACVDLQTDPENCGSCGTACPTGQCSGGECLSSCGGAQVDLDSDPDNCGACGTACGSCTQGCLSGACGVLPTTGLVAYFKFDENDGGTTYDSSPSGLSGVVTGDWTSGYQESAIQYDGQTTSVVVQDPSAVLPSGNSPRSVAAWIYIDPGDLDSPFGTSGDILQMGYGNCVPVDGNMYGIGAAPGGSGWALTVWGGCDDFGSTLDLPAQQWLFVGATFDGCGTTTAYVDDQSQSQQGMTYATTAGQPMYIGFEDLDGSPNDTGSGHFTGIIDEVRVYDRALSPAEMNELYRGTRPGLPLQCGAACVDGESSSSNCGACGVACGAGLTCSGGKCQ